MLISSKIVLGNCSLKDFSEDQIKNEPMFFNSSLDFAYDNGGKIMEDFIEKFSEEIKNNSQVDWPDLNKIVLDSRAHMLMPGWYPCIPGYHHDDVPRERSDGQPEYRNPSYRSKHVLALYNGDICPTSFALGDAEFSDPEVHDIIYKYWHDEVVKKLEEKKLDFFKAPSNKLVFFDDRTWHEGTKAVKNGWRYFIRASWNTARKPTNEIRKQVQVYLENPTEGW
jgi:hypothetical protein